MPTTMTGHTPHECAECTLPFDPGDWEERHTNAEGFDAHPDCCDVCAADDAVIGGAELRRLIGQALADEDHACAPFAIERLADAIVDRFDAAGLVVRRAL